MKSSKKLKGKLAIVSDPSTAMRAREYKQFADEDVALGRQIMDKLNRQVRIFDSEFKPPSSLETDFVYKFERFLNEFQASVQVFANNINNPGPKISNREYSNLLSDIAKSYNILANYVALYQKKNRISERDLNDIREKFDALYPEIAYVASDARAKHLQNASDIEAIRDRIFNRDYRPINVRIHTKSRVPGVALGPVGETSEIPEILGHVAPAAAPAVPPVLGAIARSFRARRAAAPAAAAPAAAAPAPAPAAASATSPARVPILSPLRKLARSSRARAAIKRSAATADPAASAAVVEDTGTGTIDEFRTANKVDVENMEYNVLTAFPPYIEGLSEEDKEIIAKLTKMFKNALKNYNNGKKSVTSAKKNFKIMQEMEIRISTIITSRSAPPPSADGKSESKGADDDDDLPPLEANEDVEGEGKPKRRGRGRPRKTKNMDDEEFEALFKQTIQELQDKQQQIRKPKRRTAQLSIKFDHIRDNNFLN